MSDLETLSRAEPGEAGTAPESVGVQVAADTTSVACYFVNASGATAWYWGLNNDNSYFKLNGSWTKTPYTRLTKFVTGTGAGEITAAAEKARSYYNLNGYTLMAAFAADSGSGYNYPLVAGGTELFPLY